MKEEQRGGAQKGAAVRLIRGVGMTFCGEEDAEKPRCICIVQ